VPHLIWSPEALVDVQRIYRFLYPKSPDAATRTVATIREDTQITADHAETDRPTYDIDPEFREWPISFGGSGYVVLYRWDQKVAIIVAVRHQREVGY